MTSEEQVDYAAKKYHEKIFRGMQIVVRARKTFKFAVAKKNQSPISQPSAQFGFNAFAAPSEDDHGIFRDPRLQQVCRASFHFRKSL
jgi:hypothetical protein